MTRSQKEDGVSTQDDGTVERINTSKINRKQRDRQREEQRYL